MMKGKYEEMVERFESYYPYLYEQAADWWPSGRSCITVKLEDGLLFEYNSVDSTIRKVQTDMNVKNPETLRKEIGHNLQKVMSTRSIPQSKVAEQSGMTQAMLSRYIHGTSMPGIDKIYALASTLGCRVVDILGEFYEE